MRPDPTAVCPQDNLEVHCSNRAHQIDLRLPHVWGAAVGLPRLRGALPDGLVRRVARDADTRPLRQSNCQELWIEGDQAAAFFPRFFCGSHCTPSSNRTPARTSGTSSAASTLRQCPSATCSSLNAIINPAVREPAPFVTPSRKRTVANVDSMGFVVRRCFQCSAG